MHLRPQRTAIEGPVVPRAEAAYRVEPDPSLIDLGQVIGAFQRNIWLILATTAVALGIAAYIVSKDIDQYTATAIIRLIDRNPGTGGETAVEGTGGKPAVGTVDPVLSEMMVLQGRTVLGEAVDREGFRIFHSSTMAPAGFIEDVQISVSPDSLATIQLQFDEDGVFYGPSDDSGYAAYGELIAFEGVQFVVPAPPGEKFAKLYVVPRNWAVDYLQAGLTTEPQAGTGGINVSFKSLDPWIPPRIVNSTVEVYQEVNAELARQNVRRRRAFLEEQLRTTDSLLTIAQSGLSGLRAREQSYSAAGRFTAEQSNLISVEIQQAQMLADLRLQENILNRVLQARASGESADLSSLMSMPGLASAPVISQLYGQLVTHHAEREALVAGPWAKAVSHPDVQRLDVLIRATEQKIVEAAQDHVASLRAQVNSLGSLRGRALAKMSDLPRTEVEEMNLTQNLAALQQMGDQLREQYQTVRLEEAAEGGLVEIVQLATQSVPITSSPWTRLFLGLISGLMLGGGLALVREKLDHSINRPEQIEQILLVPNLAVIPQATPYLLDSGTNGGSRSTLEPPGAEAYRVLRTNLLFAEGKLRTLVITSAAPGEGKTITAVNLAAAIARQGLKVLLMECDLRRPSLSQYFDEQNGIDLTNVILEDRAWREAIHSSGVPGLDLLLASRAVPRAGEYLAGAEMKQLIDEISQEYDMVILDTSPLLVAADATVLGAIVDGVLLVVRTTRTDREALQQAVHQLSLVGAHVVGTVLNDPEGAVGRYSNYYYDYSAEYEVQ
jgi:capsular exopolysaccharide synthesis family protein